MEHKSTQILQIASPPAGGSQRSRIRGIASLPKVARINPAYRIFVVKVVCMVFFS
jgi:hypothetical protein